MVLRRSLKLKYREGTMNLTRRQFGEVALGTVAASSAFNKNVFAQAAPTRMKFGIQFPAAHPAASRMAEACEEIKTETGGEIDIAVSRTLSSAAKLRCSRSFARGRSNS